MAIHLVVLTDRNDSMISSSGSSSAARHHCGQTPLQPANREQLRELLNRGQWRRGVHQSTIRRSFMPEKGCVRARAQAPPQQSW